MVNNKGFVLFLNNNGFLCFLKQNFPIFLFFLFLYLFPLAYQIFLFLFFVSHDRYVLFVCVYSCCGAGTAADTEKTTDLLSSNLTIYSLNSGRNPRVVMAVNILQDMLYR